MKLRMADCLINQIIVYPNVSLIRWIYVNIFFPTQDFRQREQDFNNRRHAQDIRRLFYLSHEEAREPTSLIHLQNRYVVFINVYHKLLTMSFYCLEQPNI